MPRITENQFLSAAVARTVNDQLLGVDELDADQIHIVYNIAGAAALVGYNEGFNACASRQWASDRAERRDRSAQATEHEKALIEKATQEERNDWANYIETWVGTVGAPEFTAQTMIELLRGPRPFGIAVAEGSN